MLGWGSSEEDLSLRARMLAIAATVFCLCPPIGTIDAAINAASPARALISQHIALFEMVCVLAAILAVYLDRWLYQSGWVLGPVAGAASLGTFLAEMGAAVGGYVIYLQRAT